MSKDECYQLKSINYKSMLLKENQNKKTINCMIKEIDNIDILLDNECDNSKKETKLTSTTNILSELDDFMRTFEIDDNSVESKKYISKGLFGYMSYDSIKFFENIEVENDSYGDEIPEIFYSFYREIIVINTFNNEATLISHSGDIEKINTLEKLIKTKKTNEFSFKIEDEIKSNLKDNEYLEMVKKGIKHCFRGDVFQIVLSRKFSQKFSDNFASYIACFSHSSNSNMSSFKI